MELGTLGTGKNCKWCTAGIFPSALNFKSFNKCFTYTCSTSVYIANMPAGTSIWNLEHRGQVRIASGVPQGSCPRPSFILYLSMNASRIHAVPVYISSMTAWTSIWNLEHWGQVKFHKWCTTGIFPSALIFNYSMNTSRIHAVPVYISNMPAWTSTSNLEHRGQVRIAQVVYRRIVLSVPHF